MARNAGPSAAERRLMETCRPFVCPLRISARPSGDFGEARIRFVAAVADVVAGGVVVAAVYLLAGAVQVDADRRPVRGVGDPVYPPVVGQDRRGPVFGTPGQLPRLLQAGVLEDGAVVEAIVALLQDGPDHGSQGAPRRVVGDRRPRARGPYEDQHRERPVRGVA